MELQNKQKTRKVLPMSDNHIVGTPDFEDGLKFIRSEKKEKKCCQLSEGLLGAREGTSEMGKWKISLKLCRCSKNGVDLMENIAK